VNDFIFALILGIGAGGVYAMLSTGLVTAFKGSGVINFAQGAFAMYAAYTYDQVNTAGQFKLPWVDIFPTHGLNVPVTIGVGEPRGAFVSAVIALLMSAFLGVLAHFLVFRPLRSSPALGKVIGAVGVMLYLQTVAEINFGSSSRQNSGFLPGTTGNDTTVSNFLGLGDMPTAYLWYAGCAIVMGAAVWALLRFTRFGLATRACDENEKGASLLGYSPQRVALLNWVLSAVLAGVTGIIIIGLGALQVAQFSLLIVPALAAALVGNLTSIPLAVLGGFLIGVLQSGIVHLAEKDWWPDYLPSTGVRTFIPLLIVVLVLFFRGNALPVRGSIIERRQPIALEAQRPWVGALIGAVLIAVLSMWLTGQWEVSLTTTLVTAMLMLSWVVIVGFVGQISLAQTALAGVAAFVAIRLASSGKVLPGVITPVEGPGWPSPLAFLVGVGVAVLVGLLVGLPALRIRGVQLAIVTIAAVGPISDLILVNKSIFGEAATTAMAVPPPRWFGINVGARDPVTNLDDYWHFTAFAGGILILMGLAVAHLRRGATGRRFLAVRSNERAAAAAGINVSRTKLLGVAIASAFAGVAGVLQAYRLGSVQATSYSLFLGLGIFAVAYLGGITSVWGAVVGGTLVAGGLVSQILSELSGSDFRSYMSVIAAIGLILTAILNPEGIATGNALLAKHLWAKRRGREGRAAERELPPLRVDELHA
jgi:branched-chain amino acid transport system permease protein